MAQGVGLEFKPSTTKKREKLKIPRKIPVGGNM
jgi:hypothetical protein